MQAFRPCNAHFLVLTSCTCSCHADLQTKVVFWHCTSERLISRKASDDTTWSSSWWRWRSTKTSLVCFLCWPPLAPTEACKVSRQQPKAGRQLHKSVVSSQNQTSVTQVSRQQKKISHQNRPSHKSVVGRPENLPAGSLPYKICFRLESVVILLQTPTA